MLKWIKWAIVVAIMLTAVNDGGRLIVSWYQLTDGSRQMAFAAAQVAKVNSAQNSGWPAAAQIAQDKGIEVVGYAQSGAGASVKTRMMVPDTWVAGRISALLTRQPQTAPFYLTYQTSSTG